MRVTIGGAVIEDSKILLVKKKDSWILPGGKLEPEESHLSCLAREFGEELSGTTIDVGSAKYHDFFDIISPNKRLSTRVEVYRVELSSKVGEPSREIIDKRWFSYDDAASEQISEDSMRMLDSLRQKGYL